MKKNLLIALVVLIIFLLIKHNNCESFENICTTLQNNSKEKILKYTTNQFGKNIDIIIDPFINLKKIEPEITIEEYLVENNIPVGQIEQAVFLIKTIVNNNCLMSALSEYDVTKQTLLKDVVQTWLLDNLKNSLICLINDKKTIELIIQQIGILIIKPYVEICSKEKFIEYCDANYTQNQKKNENNIEPKVINIPNNPTNPTKNKKYKVANKKQIENFANELAKTATEIKTGSLGILDIENKMLPLVSNSPKFMSVESIEKIINEFNYKSFGDDVEEYLKELITQYKNKYNKDLNISVKSEFTNFVLLLIDNYNELIGKIQNDNFELCDEYENDISCNDKISQLVNKFNGYKKIYYMLKHYYKIVSVYELINANVKENDLKVQAMLCCTKQGENSCYNFSPDIKNPSAIIYGFNDYGYVNIAKCVQNSPEAKENELEQKKSLDEILSNKYELWKQIPRENKAIIFGSIINIFKIYGIQLNSLDENLGKIRNNLKNSGNTISINEFNKIIKVNESDIINKLNITNPDYLKTLELIEKAETIQSLKQILGNYGFTNEYVVFNANVILDVAKQISKVALFAKFLFNNWNFSNSIPQIVKIMGIANTKQTFYEIFMETPIVPRYFTLIQQAIMTSIANSNFAVVSKYDINSIPINVINYVKSKPTDQTLNLCDVYSLALGQFRKDRAININEYNDIDEKMIMYCDPNKITLDKISSSKIPISETKGLNVLERSHLNYSAFVNENNQISKNNLKSEIVSDNILYNFIKNTYN